MKTYNTNNLKSFKHLFIAFALVVLVCNAYMTLAYRVKNPLDTVPKPNIPDYDTMVIFNPYTLNVGAVYFFDTNVNYSMYKYDVFGDLYKITVYYNKLFGNFQYNIWRDSICGIEYNNFTNHYGEGQVMGGNWLNIKAFAQPWHLDSAVTICGVQARGNWPYFLADNNYFMYRVMDDDMNTVIEDPIRTIYTDILRPKPDAEWDTIYIGTQNKKIREFYFHDTVSMQDFLLSFDIPYSPEQGYVRASGYDIFDHTFSITDTCLAHKMKEHGYPYDTIFVGMLPHDIFNYHNSIANIHGESIIYEKLTGDEYNMYPFDYNDTLNDVYTDTIPLYQSPYPPYFKKDGEWIRFDQDTIYDIYQRTFIKFLPIIIVPKQDTTNSGNKDVLLDNNTWVYPNPTRYIVNITCGFKMNTIEIFDAMGKCVKTEKLYTNEIAIDIKDLKSGNYIVKIHTNRGIISRKLLVI